MSRLSSNRVFVKLGIDRAMGFFRSLTERMRRSGVANAAHMTFVKSGLKKSYSRTQLMLKKQIWLWPIVAFLVLSMVGFSVRSAIESTMKANLSSQLETLLRLETSMLEDWYRVQIAYTDSIANSRDFREIAYPLLQTDEEMLAMDPNKRRELGQAIKKELEPLLQVYDHMGYVVFDRSHRIVASSHEELVGRERLVHFESWSTRALAGESVVSPPFKSIIALKTDAGEFQAGNPTMFSCSPIRDESFQVVGALGLRIHPDHGFTKILQLGRLGATGEAYAFNREGVMVSNSRFDEQLILAGLLPDSKDSRSILNIMLRDPGGDMTQGFRPTVRRHEMPMTKLVASGTAGNNGVDTVGYNDYRGVPAVGAWAWLPKYDVGVAVEIDRAEAFRPLLILQWTFWTLYSLLILSSFAIFVFTILVARARREAQNAAVEAQQLGQYRLEHKLGAGAMGVVYKGYHAMLRRPTAIKLLNLEGMNDTAIQRFEHEVQITCQLNHPNTIAIYDYGRTPEGVFYYAMEYLEGIDLQTLVETYGPQSEGRVIKILLQMCGSLFEAHAQGLVHRDIKPANVMLNRRGGVPDVVKVLDFGLVKSLDASKKGVDDNVLAGTPLYLSPEAIQSPTLVDACSDLYAVGAVGYFLITGQTVFDAKSIGELLQCHLAQPPIPPSERSGVNISAEFEHAILSCLEKSRARRPQTAHALVAMLQRCPTVNDWTLEDAEAWWSAHERRAAGNDLASAGKSTSDATIVPTSGALSKSKLSKSTVANKPLDQTMWHQ